MKAKEKKYRPLINGEIIESCDQWGGTRPESWEDVPLSIVGGKFLKRVYYPIRRPLPSKPRKAPKK